MLNKKPRFCQRPKAGAEADSARPATRRGVANIPSWHAPNRRSKRAFTAGWAGAPRAEDCRRSGALVALLAAEQLGETTRPGDAGDGDDLPELGEQCAEHREKAELLRREAPDERGEAVLRDPIGRRVEVGVALARVEFERAEEPLRDRILLLDRGVLGHEVEADVAVPAERVGVVVHAARRRA